jgi:cyclase
MQLIGMRRLALALAMLCLMHAHVGIAAQEPRAPVVTTVQVAERVSLLQGLACNVLVVSGPDGALVIDHGLKREAASLRQAVASLAPAGIRATVLTHIHWDHVGASETLGLEGVEIIAHENTRKRMTEEWSAPEAPVGRFPVIQPYPDAALPTRTFPDSMHLRFGGQDIRILHYPGGHSDTDVVVFLPESDVVHAGDLFESNGFPIVDSFHGGTIDGYIRNVDAVIQEVGDKTVVVPGHGPVSNREGLRKYRAMLVAARARIAERIESGMTLEELLASDPTAGLYEGGTSWINPKLFVWTVFVDLTGQGR